MMNKIIILIILISIVLVICEEHNQQQEQKQQQKNVLKLTPQTFKKTLQDNKFVFIQFYASFDEKCVKFTPEYEQLAIQVKKEGLSYVIATINMQDQNVDFEELNVYDYPGFKFYIFGNQVKYSGKWDRQQILNFINKTSESKLNKVCCLGKVTKPAIVVYGISQDSQLQLLDRIFTRLPIYLVNSRQFSLDVYTKRAHHHYTGQANLNSVVEYLIKVTEQDQIVPNFILDVPIKKVQDAITNKVPILAIIHRDTIGQSVLELLETYCMDKSDFICGYAKSGNPEYQEFNNYVEDPVQNTSRLIYIRTQNFEIFLYNGDLNTLNEEKIDQFLADIQSGKIKYHISAHYHAPESLKDQQQNNQEGSSNVQGAEITSVEKQDEQTVDQTQLTPQQL